MKKTIIAVLLLCGLSAAQSKQKVAVYMTGKEPDGIVGVHKVLGGELAKTISESDKYSAVDRTDAILSQLTREQYMQRSGAVSSDQIRDIGKYLGVQYLSIAEISPVAKRSYYLDVRLVDVETAEIMRTVTAGSGLENANEMIRVAKKLAYELIETEKVKERIAYEETRRDLKKKALFYGAIGAEALGAGLIAYGVLENSNVGKHVSNGKYAEAENSAKNRNTALTVGGIFLLSGITIHIFF
ncbi:MAG: CsgG/HfaB family protein [Chitinispirillales bacterium]|jgi:hypothetical protein|nr:CsgG/HfaB family protein [Chitinispirillales bacterium]